MRTFPAVMMASLLLMLTAAGCLSDGDQSVSGASTQATESGYKLACVELDGPLFDAETGRVADVCNVAVTVGESPVNEPAIASNPTNPCNLIAGGNDYNAGTDVWAGVYVSFDCGQTWERDFLPGHPGDEEQTRFSQFTGAGDAAIAFDLDGTAYYAGIAFDRAGASTNSRQAGGAASVAGGTPASLIVARSDDGGRTWPGLFVPELGTGAYGSASVPVAPADQTVGAGGAVHNEFEDKEWIAVAPDGTVYVSWTRFGGVYPWVSDVDDQLGAAERPREEANIYLIRSDDRGETWTNEILVSRHSGNQGSVPAVAPDGTLHIIWMEFNQAEEGEEALEFPISIVTRYSTDKGATFSEPQVLAEVAPVEAKHRFRTNGFPSLAIDPLGSPFPGRLTATWGGNVTGDSDIWMSESTDNGQTWSEPMRVNQDPVGNGAQQYLPWVSVGNDGVRTFVWYDARHDESLSTMAVWMGQTSDGVNFDELPVTDAPFLTDRDGFATSNFLGDYLNVASSTAGAFAIWPDTRSGTDAVGNTDLYVAWLHRPTPE